jgi:glycosyltransferase involved in cell wall biosynthesis
MKIYFILGVYQGCDLVRGLLPMWHNGWDGNMTTLSGGIKDAKTVMNGIKNSDIVVFHRPESMEANKIGAMVKSMGKLIVFDNDDSFKFDEWHPCMGIPESEYAHRKDIKNGYIDAFVQNSDLITCSTEALKEEYSKLNKKVIVLPNYVDPDDWDPIPLRNEGDKVRIGIIGSVAYHHDFQEIQDYIRELSLRKNIQLVMFGLGDKEYQKKNPYIAKKIWNKEFDFWNSIKNLESVPWIPMQEYFHKLNELRLDIMLIPRKENGFTKAKSNLKFLEAGMCEIPVVAQSFKDKKSPYDKDIKDFENGVLALNEKEFKEKTDRLINDKELRRRIGREAKQYVLTNYDIKQHAHLWNDAYRTIFK